MAKLAAVLFVISFFLGIYSCSHRNDIPEKVSLNPQSLQEPLQSATNEEAFTIGLEQETYTIKPLFDYEITGLVVSLRHHSGESMLHKLLKDHLNVVDLCVVWGANAASPILHEIEFWSRQFTCSFRYPAHLNNQFNFHQISNNHLLASDPWLRESLRDVNVGDQITVRGWLAEYSVAGGGTRGTSTVRTDTGNGACETIFVRSINVLQAGERIWFKSMVFFFALSVCMLIIYFKAPIAQR